MVEANSLALSVCSRWSHPPPPKWEALAVHAKLPVSPEALPLGELSPQVTERARMLLIIDRAHQCLDTGHDDIGVGAGTPGDGVIAPDKADVGGGAGGGAFI